MANYVVKIYNQTGFDTCNVPDSPRMIESNFTPYKTYDTFELVQGRYLSTLRVQLTAKEANKIDLVVISSDLINDTTVYTVDGYDMKAPDVCEFHLLLEPYSTLGGFGYDSGNWVLNGSIKRCHVSVEDDNKNFYTLPEPFENREPVEWTVNRLTTRSNFITLIETLSIPSKIIPKDGLTMAYLDGHADVSAYNDSIVSRASATSGAFCGYDTDNKDSFVYQYMESIVPRVMVGTKYKVPNGEEINLGVRWWNANFINYKIMVYKIGQLPNKPESGLVQEEYQGDLLSDLASDGRSGDITAIWQVPAWYVNDTTKPYIDYNPEKESADDYGGYKTIESTKETGNIALTKWATTTYNNKLNYGQNLRIKIYNPASNGTIEHSVTDVMTPGSAAEWISSVPYTLFADIRSNGNPIFMFNYLNKADNISNMIEVLNGGKWRQVPLNISGVITKDAIMGMQHRNELNETDTMMNITNMITSMITGLNNTAMSYRGTDSGNSYRDEWMYNQGVLGQTNVLTNAINQGYNIWRNNRVVQQQNAELNCRAAMASVNLSKDSSTFANDMNNNGFFSIVSHFSNNDLQAFDTFLTRYGYNVGNMPFDGDQTYFYNRPSYNFVQVNDMTVESVTGNVNLVNDCVERLKQGLRIWHVKPNAKDMLAGGNR